MKLAAADSPKNYVQQKTTAKKSHGLESIAEAEVTLLAGGLSLTLLFAVSRSTAS